jgi:hypothetical protein
MQSIELPVFRIQGNDTLRYFSKKLRYHIVSRLSREDTLHPKFLKETAPAPVALRINYPYILGGMTFFLLCLFALNFFFDKPIQKFFLLWIEQRRQARFLKSFEKIQENLEEQLSIQLMEALIVLWKAYLQKVSGEPYSTYTSLEINRILQDPALKKSLQAIDRWIYGELPVENLPDCLNTIKQKAIVLYEQKRESIRNGKSGKT